MSMMTLKCPKCQAEAKLSLADDDYSGPRRCWKCHEYFTITIHNNKVTFCEPLSKEEFEQQQAEQKAAAKAGVPYRPSPKPQQQSSGGIDYTKQSQMDFPDPGHPQPGQDAGEEAGDIFKILAGKSKGGIDFGSPSSSSTPAPSAPAPAPRAEKAPVEETAENFDIFNHIKSGTKSDSGTSSRQSSEAPPKAMVPKQEFIRPADYEAPLPKPAAKKPVPKAPPTGDLPPFNTAQPTTKPVPIRTFVPMEDIPVEPENPKKKRNPPADHFNLFVPPQT
jgi:hypothetical protein